MASWPGRKRGTFLVQILPPRSSSPQAGGALARRALLLAAAGLLLGAAATPVSGEAARSVDAGASRMSQLARGLAAGEYRASRNRRGLQAPNRAHGLRIYFEPSGIRLHDRTGAAQAELLGLSLVAVGRGEALDPVASGRVVSRGARVEIHRPGLVEWYENSPAGLEQGFTLARRPDGDRELVLELRVEGARAFLRGGEIVFETGAGRQLHYGKLAAFDARGRELEARLVVRSRSRFWLVVDDGGAVYPVVIDPLLTVRQVRIDSDQAASRLGFSVAGAGDVNGDGYDDVIVGAYLYDAGESDEGAAFVFLGSATGIPSGDPNTAATRLQSNQMGAELGISVAGAGDVNGDGYDDVIVGARFYDARETDEGAAFVFLGSASGIADGDPNTAAARLESNQSFALFGASVAGAGDVNDDGYDDVVAGAYLYESNPMLETDEGAAFVFLGSASGIADGDPNTAATRLDSNQDLSLFGLSVAGAGDVNGDGYDDAIVGAPFYDAGEDNEGVAFVFLGSASGIADGGPATAAARLESDQQDADMGFSVAGAGDVNGDGYGDVIVGADEYDAGEAGEGAAFVFLGSASGIANGDPNTAATRLESNQVGADFGISVAGAGDVDGDSYDDVIVGAHLYDVGGSEQGAAFVFLGGPSGIAHGDPVTAAAQLNTGQPDSEMGRSVAGAGDVDGDGDADVIAGAPSLGATEPGGGAAFVFSLGPVLSVPALSLPSRALLALLLVGVAACGLRARRR
jgi:hypothetical protein